MIIKTSQEFEKIVKIKKGFVVVTAPNNFAHIHLIFCRYINKQYFLQKVIKNKGKNGNYFWIDSENKIMRLFPNAKPCRHCNPLEDGKLHFDNFI